MARITSTYIGFRCNVGDVTTDLPTSRSSAATWSCTPPAWCAPCAGTHELPAGFRVLSLLDEHGPLGISALATLDRSSQPTMSGAVAGARRARAGRQAAEPRRRPGQRDHADRPGPQRAGPRAGELRRHRRRALLGHHPAHSPEDLATAVAVLRDLLDTDRPKGTLVSTTHHPAHPLARGGDPPGTGGFFDQPRAVWAVAFACVIAFMGIGLVDPILKPIADQLDATPEPGLAALHQLHGGDGRRDARHRRGLQPDRRQAHPARRAGA